MDVMVNMAAKIVAVDGLALVCDFTTDSTIASIRWHGDALYGHITPAAGVTGGGDFRDPATAAPYVAAWRTAVQKRLDTNAADQTAEAAAYQKYLADEAAKAKALAAAAKAKALPAPAATAKK
jgi:hypothetical protein